MAISPTEERPVVQPPAQEVQQRIQIQDVRPQVDGGRYAAKATVGDAVTVGATIFRDGHEVLGAAVRFRPAGESRWRETPMVHEGNDRWSATLGVDRCGRWQYAVGAWVDRFASWRYELSRKVEAGQEDLSSELSEGAVLYGVESITVETALADGRSDRSEFTSADELELDVDRVRARFGSWYELFPRSWGGFAGVERALPQLADLGFDVVYLPPIHPIGRTNRKGKNNALVGGRTDPGSPWAIGAAEGGHAAVHPELGTLVEFDRLVARACDLEIDICLDFAIQCSPDHPWLTEHPEWFHRRPDGTLKYAENPPKRYQDIYNVNFESEEWQALWDELRTVVLGWCRRGVRVFRVDNPHTKPVPFWEWLIREVRSEDPEVIFLAEAFTRPAMMQTLGKIGFSQSYTYFTWKNSRSELIEFMRDVVAWSPYYRPNFFANTPDILHEYLQQGGRAAFEARLVLAATLSPSYGIYSGFEHHENVPLRPGSEEYLDSEKYEAKERRLDGPLLPLVRRLNKIRRENVALQYVDNISFLETESEHLLAYSKRTGGNTLVAVVNLDAEAPREGLAVVPASLGLPPTFTGEELLTATPFRWQTGRNYVRLRPGESHIVKLS